MNSPGGHQRNLTFTPDIVSSLTAPALRLPVSGVELVSLTPTISSGSGLVEAVSVLPLDPLRISGVSSSESSVTQAGSPGRRPEAPACTRHDPPNGSPWTCSTSRPRESRGASRF